MTKKTLSRWLIALLLFGTLTSAFVYAGGPQKVSEARCNAGAFVTHANQVGVVASDNDADLQAGNSGSAALNPSSTAFGDNLMVNGGMETGVNGTPDHWDHHDSGTNDHQYSVVAGHNSDAAGRVQITSYKDGDAHWYQLPINVTPGAYYQYDDFYRANVPTRAVLEMVDGQGQMRFINLHSAPIATDWTQYTAKFIIPKDIKQIVVYHNLTAAGTLDVDDSALHQAHLKGFSQPLVSITFDDGWESSFTDALPLLKKYNLPSTQYIISGYVGSGANYVQPSQVYAFQKAGSEIASHTLNHPDLTKLSDSKQQSELQISKMDLSHCYGTVTDFAPPYGTYSDATIAKTKKLYSTSRSTDTGYNTADSFEPYALQVQNVDSTTSSAELQSWVDTAKANHAWLILVYHQVNDASKYSRSSANLENDFKTVKDSGIKVMTVRDGYNLVTKQKS